MFARLTVLQVIGPELLELVKEGRMEEVRAADTAAQRAVNSDPVRDASNRMQRRCIECKANGALTLCAVIVRMRCGCDAQAEQFAQAQVDAAASRSPADQLSSLRRMRLVVSTAAR